MNSIVCTLFEKNYHFGLAVLTNSLYRYNYRGEIFAGYRGGLPEWANGANDNPSLNWKGAKTFEVASDLKIHFLPIETDYHFTNYKPEFMLRLFDGPCRDIEAIAYIDPDIVVKCEWDFFETWMSHGVALVHEIVGNDMPPTHPIRKEWEKVIKKCDKKPNHIVNSYINGGFCGLNRENVEFLMTWKKIIEIAAREYNSDVTKFQATYSRADVFYICDQDALNITAMCSESPISEMGPEAMDFIPGGFTMSHSTGNSKPWNKKFIVSAIMGIPPTLTDKAFWANVDGPIKPYTISKIRLKKLCLNISAFIGRFYSRK